VLDFGAITMSIEEVNKMLKVATNKTRKQISVAACKQFLTAERIYGGFEYIEILHKIEQNIITNIPQQIYSRVHYYVVAALMECMANKNKTIEYLALAERSLIYDSLPNDNLTNYHNGFVLNGVLKRYQEEFLPLFNTIEHWDINWRTSNTAGLAQTMVYDDDFSTRGLLKDALMDAGCEDEQVLWMVNNANLCRGCSLLEKLL
jgi:hypothetical protein